MLKQYWFDIGRRRFLVQAEQEGDARYMVRMTELATSEHSLPTPLRVRIGYVFGQKKNWIAEFVGKKTPKPARSAKIACQQLAEWAVTQQGFCLPAAQ